jgi:hypothetical protein
MNTQYLNQVMNADCLGQYFQRKELRQYFLKVPSFLIQIKKHI